MQGYPKHLNSRADYDYVQANFPNKFAEEFAALKTTAYMWVPTGEHLDSREQGVEDATHRVEVAGEGENAGFEQYARVINPNGKFFQMGYTETELA